MSRPRFYLNSFRGYWPTATALSSSPLSACILFVSLLSVPLRKRVFGRQPMKVTLFVGGKKVAYFVRDGTDISALREVFAEGEYAFDQLPAFSPRRIADLGAHVGASTLYFHGLYPDATITAYEPDPENFALLTMNVGSLPGITCVNAAVAGTSGTITFYPNQGGSTRSSTVRLEDSGEGIKVSAVRFDEVARGVDLVKFDIEGAELELFTAASPESRADVTRYVGEVHHYLIHQTQGEFAHLFPTFTPTWKDHGKNISIVALVQNAS